MTGYDLQQFIKKNLVPICLHSAGSVQAALSKLEKESKVTTSEAAQERRWKKIFALQTPAVFAELAKPEERLCAIRDDIRQM